MALIKCPECKNQISEFAPNCPNCGFPLTEEIISNIKIEKQKKNEEEIKAKEQKERESREFLESLEVPNSRKEKISEKTNKTNSESNLKEVAPRKKNKKAITYLIIVIVLVIVVVSISKMQRIKNSPPSTTNIKESEEVLSTEQEAEESASMLKYRIVEKKDISFSGTKRMTYRMEVDVDSIPSIYQMNDAAIHYWKTIKTTADEFTFFIYLPAMSITNAAYGVVEFSNAGIISSNINKHALYGTKWEVKENKKETKKVPVAKLTEYRINLSAVKINGNEIKISIETNFPDGTNFLVTVGRIHYLKGESEEYSGEIFDKDFSVNQGKIETTVKVNDSGWYNEHLRLVKALPDDIKPISKISDNVTISVMFSPKRKQLSNILKIVGTDGEYITGKGADNEYGFTTFNVSKEVNIPLQR